MVGWVWVCVCVCECVCVVVVHVYAYVYVYVLWSCRCMSMSMCCVRGELTYELERMTHRVVGVPGRCTILYMAGTAGSRLVGQEQGQGTRHRWDGLGALCSIRSRLL